MREYGTPSDCATLPPQPLQKLFAAHSRAVGAGQSDCLYVSEAVAIRSRRLQHARRLLERSRICALSSEVYKLELEFGEVHGLDVYPANNHHHQLLGSILQQARLSPSQNRGQPLGHSPYCMGTASSSTRSR